MIDTYTFVRPPTIAVRPGANKYIKMLSRTGLNITFFVLKIIS